MHVQVKTETHNTATAEDLPEEGQGGARFCLRFRWYRSVVQRSGANCWIHPDREATLQCVLCLRCKVGPSSNLRHDCCSSASCAAHCCQGSCTAR